MVATDEEGGDVTRLYADVGSPVLGAAALGAADDLDLTEATGRAVGSDLAAAGIDLTLAPVADLNTNPANPVIGVRSFGSDPARAGEHVAAWVRGLQSAGIAACAKHFPGHGDTSDDSHLTLPVVDADQDTLDERELVPFAAAIRADAAAVMTSHLLLPRLDPDHPATMSATVLDLLRARLGYDGAIVTDALDMAGASGGRGIPEAAVLSLIAGADLLCLGSDSSDRAGAGGPGGVVTAVGDGRLSAERLAEAQRRVSILRRTTTPAVTELDPVAQLAGARAALTVEGDVPDLADAAVTRIDTTPNIAVGVVPWGLSRDGRADRGPTARSSRCKDAHRHPHVREQLAGAGRGRAGRGGRVRLAGAARPRPAPHLHAGRLPALDRRRRRGAGRGRVVGVTAYGLDVGATEDPRCRGRRRRHGAGRRTAADRLRPARRGRHRGTGRRPAASGVRRGPAGTRRRRRARARRRWRRCGTQSTSTWGPTRCDCRAC